MVSTKLHPGVNFWIQATLCACYRLEAHPRLKFVILSSAPAIDEETDGAQKAHPGSPDYLFICLPANTTISSTRRFISSTTFSNTRRRDAEITG